MAIIANTGSIADFAWNRIDSVPSAISGTAMQQFAQTAVYQCENWTGDSIGLTAIDQKYVPFLTEMTLVMTLSRIHSIGVHYNWSLGEFHVEKGSLKAVETLMIDVATKNAEREMASLGRKIGRVYATFYG